MHATVHPDIRNAVTRVHHALRAQGWELFHLVGYDAGVNSQGVKKRREFSILFLVPDHTSLAELNNLVTEEEVDGDDGGDNSVATKDASKDESGAQNVDSDGESENGEEEAFEGEAIGHRVLAQIMIHVAEGGRHDGMMENVAVRFTHDWQDWTVIQPHDYYKDASALPGQTYGVQTDFKIYQMTSRDLTHLILKKTWAAVLSLLGGEAPGSREEFGERVGRALIELDSWGEVVSGFEAEKVFRVSGSKRNRSTALRIALFTRDKVIKVDQDPESQDTEAMESSPKSDSDTPSRRVGAVCLIDTSEQDSRIRLKHIAIVYEGEWPMVHHYRKALPPPSVSGLEDYLMDTGDSGLEC